MNNIKIVCELIIDNSEESPLWEAVAKANKSVVIGIDSSTWEGWVNAKDAIKLAGIEKEMSEMSDEWMAIWLAQEEAPSTLVLISTSGGYVITITNEK